MTMFDDPNRESLGLEPIWTASGDNVPGVLDLSATLLDVTATVTGGVSDATYTFAWGDGADDTAQSDPAGTVTASHTYGAAGTVTVTVTNPVGASTSDSILLTAAEATSQSTGKK